MEIQSCNGRNLQAMLLLLNEGSQPVQGPSQGVGGCELPSSVAVSSWCD